MVYERVNYIHLIHNTKHLILFIDTTEKDRLKFSLFQGEKQIDGLNKKIDKHSERLLPELEKFLKKNKVKLSDLKKISVNPGPGGFSSTRTGVAVANALVYALGLEQDMVLPVYDKEPNITRPKAG